jgi:hypothetical protein
MGIVVHIADSMMPSLRQWYRYGRNRSRETGCPIFYDEVLSISDSDGERDQSGCRHRGQSIGDHARSGTRPSPDKHGA